MTTTPTWPLECPKCHHILDTEKSDWYWSDPDNAPCPIPGCGNPRLPRPEQWLPNNEARRRRQGADLFKNFDEDEEMKKSGGY